MKLTISIIFFLLLFWSIFWWSDSIKKETVFKEWVTSESSKTKKKYGRVWRSGFPYRIDLNVENFSIANTTDKWSLLITNMNLMRLIYVPNKVIVTLQAPFEFKFSDTVLKITNGKIKLSMTFLKNKSLNRLIFESDQLKALDNYGLKFQLNRSVGGLRKVSGLSEALFYDFVLNIEDLQIIDLKNKDPIIQVGSKKIYLGFDDLTKLNELGVFEVLTPKTSTSIFKSFNVLIKKVSLSNSMSQNLNQISKSIKEYLEGF